MIGTVLTPDQREAKEASGEKLLRLRGDRYIPDTLKEGETYCWQCGYIAPAEEFRKNDRCPNPSCPHPEFWDD